MTHALAPTSPVPPSMPAGVSSLTGDILLEAGTNELEVLVFRLADGWFGVNVAKVREVIKPLAVASAPHQHASVMGMFNIRGAVLALIDLAGHLGLRDRLRSVDPTRGRVIITEFNGLRAGFLVDAVDQIHRMSWASVRPAPDVALTQREVASQAHHASGPSQASSVVVSAVTGVVELGQRLVLMLDFESVADAILCERRLHVGEVENPHGVDRASKRVILAEDSPFMRTLLRDVFLRSGYTGVEVYANGAEAWDALAHQAQPQGAGVRLPDAVVSDIEMPRMDGLHLCKRIKEDARLRGVPVVLFSSLISDDNRKKGRQVGADMQIPKPELREMVLLVDRLVGGCSDLRAVGDPGTLAA